VNRWRQRLAELQTPAPAQAIVQHSRRPHSVQNVQNVQKPAPDPSFEHFKQIEQSGEPPKAMAVTAAERALANWGEAAEERAAIVEHDGRIPRTWAEGFARLHPDRAPGDLSLRRWQRFIDDMGIFLDRWAAYAAALGWGPFDLFGCDRDRPFARIDQAGLLWLLNGDKLIALTENTAIIEGLAGARHTYRRKPNIPGRVLAWEVADLSQSAMKCDGPHHERRLSSSREGEE
jgi:hypothetical protein